MTVILVVLCLAIGVLWRVRTHQAKERAERELRRELGMPTHHPESMTRLLPEHQEITLALLDALSWPEDTT